VTDPILLEVEVVLVPDLPQALDLLPVLDPAGVLVLPQEVDLVSELVLSLSPPLSSLPSLLRLLPLSLQRSFQPLQLLYQLALEAPVKVALIKAAQLMALSKHHISPPVLNNLGLLLVSRLLAPPPGPLTSSLSLYLPTQVKQTQVLLLIPSFPQKAQIPQTLVRVPSRPLL